MAVRYHFITTIELGASRDQIWETLARSDEWTGWWRWLREVEVLDEGDSDGVGRRVRHQVGSPLRYRLTYVGTVTKAHEPESARFEAEGDLEGVGQFRLDPTADGGTLLVFDWMVVTPKQWMNKLARLARPILVWNHHRLMEDFAEDLASATAGELREVTNRSLRGDDDGFFEMPAVED